MDSDSFCFGNFTLDVDSRLLRQNGVTVDVTSRYFDALVLLVREAGGLVVKDRFMDEVWRGVPVTDEALTQCIRTLRRTLGDDAAQPRFIETVPKHGYRFVAQVERGGVPALVAETSSSVVAGPHMRTFWAMSGAGVVGGGMAGLVGGLFYGFAGASQPLASGMGAASIVLVLTALTVLVALIGSAGVSLGIAAAGLIKERTAISVIAGGAVGGFLIGGIVKLLGLDAFQLILGQSPSGITGALEGAALGAATGCGLWLGERATTQPSLVRRILPAAGVGALTGVGIVAAGGQLLGGSLSLLADLLPQSRLRLDQIGTALGEDGFGDVSRIVTGAMEGMLFAACITAAMLLAKRQLAD